MNDLGAMLAKERGFPSGFGIQEALVEVIARDSSSSVRQAAVICLGEVGRKYHLPIIAESLLESSLRDSDTQVRESAGQAFTAMAVPTVERLGIDTHVRWLLQRFYEALFSTPRITGDIGVIGGGDCLYRERLTVVFDDGTSAELKTEGSAYDHNAMSRVKWNAESTTRQIADLSVGRIPVTVRFEISDEELDPPRGDDMAVEVDYVVVKDLLARRHGGRISIPYKLFATATIHDPARIES